MITNKTTPYGDPNKFPPYMATAYLKGLADERAKTERLVAAAKAFIRDPSPMGPARGQLDWALAKLEEPHASD